MVVDQAQEDGVAAARRQTGVLLIAEEGGDVGELSVVDQLAEVLEVVLVDLGGVDVAALPHPLGELDRPLAVPRPDVGDPHAGLELKGLGDAVGLVRRGAAGGAGGDGQGHEDRRGGGGAGRDGTTRTGASGAYHGVDLRKGLKRCRDWLPQKIRRSTAKDLGGRSGGSVVTTDDQGEGGRLQPLDQGRVLRGLEALLQDVEHRGEIAAQHRRGIEPQPREDLAPVEARRVPGQGLVHPLPQDEPVDLTIQHPPDHVLAHPVAAEGVLLDPEVVAGARRRDLDHQLGSPFDVVVVADRRLAPQGRIDEELYVRLRLVVEVEPHGAVVADQRDRASGLCRGPTR